MADARCDRIQAEISSAHDEGRDLPMSIQAHLSGCQACSSFAANVRILDTALASGRFDRSPVVVERITSATGLPERRWWAAAAVAMVGLTVGVLLGTLGSRVDVGLASELQDLLFQTGPGVVGIEADLVVVERGVHPEVPERVYDGSIEYAAPESLSIDLVDTTSYPSDDWVHNDLRLTIADGDLAVTAGTTCPVAALPGCLTEPMRTAVIDQPPFVEGTIRPLEIVGPGRAVSVPNDLEIVGMPELGGRMTVQVETTVAGAALLSTLTDRGAWRELHPTDPVIMWLDASTLVPLRIEVFASQSSQRELWQIRRGYTDSLGGDEPIFIVSLENLVVRPGVVEFDLIDDAAVGGFIDGPAGIPRPVLPDGFVPHRSGHWLLRNGERVEVASWSDGRSWLKIELTSGWDEPRLFGMPSRFVEVVDASRGVTYLSPIGDTLAVHNEDVDAVVTGSIPTHLIQEVAASLGLEGEAVPDDWVESAVRPIDDVPSGVLVPDLEGWSALARVDDGRVEVLLTGGGDRSVLIEQSEGSTIELPVGPDVSTVDVRGVDGRFDSATGALSWVEDGMGVEMQSETVAFDELLALAESMTSR